MWNARTQEKEKVKEERETGRKDKEDPKDRDGPRESGQVQVTRGTILGIIPVARQGVWSRDGSLGG